MIYDLDTINASLALGDIVVPPKGSVINGWGKDFFVTGHVRYHWGFLLGVRDPGDVLGYHLVTLDRGGCYRLSILPVDAPPFEDWPRK